ncbi:VTC domain-containing protein [Streptomyces sp. NPDC052225]|uniref:VTC domain-containing protein n=1 Tax=Streptomyces sp. NPDC052225 TaxID=3154949 RepID=UPI003418A617
MIPAVRAIGRAALAARPLSLDELNTRAELLARRDRGYLVPVEVFADLAALLTDPRRPGGPFRALSVNGRRWFGYRSTYYDTADLRSYHDHRQGLRPRHRIRERLYRDTGQRQLEIEVGNGRGETVKHRRRLTGDDQVLDAAGRGFLAGVLSRAYGVAPPDGLRPSLVTHYQRATFVADGQRVTCDAGLVVRDVSDGRTVRADGGLVLVETKTRGALTEADRVLDRFGVRVSDVTQYCAGLAALRPELGAHRRAAAVREAFPGA